VKCDSRRTSHWARRRAAVLVGFAIVAATPTAALPSDQQRTNSDALFRYLEAKAAEPLSSYYQLSWGPTDDTLFLTRGFGDHATLEKVDIKTGRAEQLAFGMAPVLSPRRDLVAYKGPHQTLVVAHFARGRLATIASLPTQTPGASQDDPWPVFAWSTDGERLFYRAYRRLPTGVVTTAILVFDVRTRASRLYYSYRNGAKALSSADEVNPSIGFFAHAPDDALIVVQGQGTYYAGQRADLISVVAGKPQLLLRAISNYADIRKIVVSPDGRHVALPRVEDPEKLNFSALAEMGALKIGDKTWHMFKGPFADNRSDDIAWSPSSGRAYYICKRGAYANALCAGDPQTGTVQEIALESMADIKTFCLDPTGKRVAWVSRDSHDVIVLHTARLDGQDAKTVLVLQSAPSVLPSWATRSLVHWTSFDGLGLEGVLVLPANRDPKRPLPLVVDVHGGPIGGIDLDGSLLNTSPLEADAWAARGYATLVVDYRKGLVADPNRRRSVRIPGMSLDAGDAYDVIAGIEQVVAMGVADPKHIVGIGHSYGAFVLAQLVEQSDILTAAIAYEGAHDYRQIISRAAELPAGRSMWPYLFNVASSEVPFWASESSTAAHAYKIRTPMLFITAGDNDPKIGGQKCRATETFVRDIRKGGTSAEMVYFPDDYHVVSKAKNIHVLTQVVTSWIDKYAGTSELPLMATPDPVCTRP
jgi:dipeptidyl aminopeptidase/acylaminoacyl peptidase